ncbi:hypothetical protein C8F01DRAFT_1156775 [Mycena amicta]|nr:hypothetical protein C8F01DRAFT_1156775 [Mycena amicta]
MPFWSRRSSRILPLSAPAATEQVPQTRNPNPLPLELHFLIIDQFASDSAQLRNASLVCLAWAAHVQSILFRTVSVRSQTTQRFVAALSTTRDLGRYVTKLDVKEAGVWDHTVFHDKLPNLRTLCVTHGAFTPQPEMYSRITSLTLRFCRFATAAHMLSFIAGFQALESLEVFQCSLQLYADPRMPQNPPAVVDWSLKHLAIGAHPQNPLIEWLASPSVSMSLERLRILSLGHDASSFNTLLAKVGSGLTHLEVPGTPRRQSTGGSEIPLSLRLCTSLSVLTFSERSPAELSRGVISAFSQLRTTSTTHSLTAIAFKVQLNTTYLDVPWEEIEISILGEGSPDLFSNLRTVTLHLWGSLLPRNQGISYFDEAVLLLEDRMVLLEARGLLRFLSEEDGEEEKVSSRSSLPNEERNTARQRSGISSRLSSWFIRGDRDDRVIPLTTRV